MLNLFNTKMFDWILWLIKMWITLISTQREAERRQRLVDNLNYREKQMEFSINNPDSAGRFVFVSKLARFWLATSIMPLLTSTALPIVYAYLIAEVPFWEIRTMPGMAPAHQQHHTPMMMAKRMLPGTLMLMKWNNSKKCFLEVCLGLMLFMSSSTVH